MGAAGAMTMDSIANGDVRITVSGRAVVNKSEVLGWGVAIAGGFNGKVGGGTYIEINGGTVNGDIVGGMFHAAGSGFYIDGSTNVTVSKGTINGDIYGGAPTNETQVRGDSTVSFAGDGADIKFSGTVYGDGGAYYKNSTVKGAKTFNFGTAEQGFAGGFNGKLNGFDIVSVAEKSNVIWNNFSQDTLVMASGDAAIVNEGKMNLVLNSSVKKGAAMNFTATDITKLTVGGGSYKDGVITFGGADTSMSVGGGDSSAPIKVGSGDNDVATVVIGGASGAKPAVTMSFDTTTLGDGQLSVKSVSDVIAGVAPSEVEGMVTALAAFSFDVDGQTEEGLGTTVVLSFYLGDLYDGASQLAVWHRKNAGDAWKLLNTEVKYDGENALFTADRFSDYMVGAVPEPAAVAGILGSLALAFSAYRRQNRR